LALLLQSVSGSAATGGVESAASTRAQPRSGGQTKAGRRELVFLDAGMGAAYFDVLALKDGELLDPARVKSSGFGLMGSAAFGVRLQEFTFALRYRYADLSDWQLWTFGGEAGMNFSLGRIEPYFGLGAGYASLDGIVSDISRAFTPLPAPAIDIHGLDLRVNAGLSYYVSRWFSVGANLSADAFFLRRKGDHLIRRSSTDPNSRPAFLYGTDGSGNGLGAALSLVLGLHY
jgi:hypothetical protein